MKEKYYLNEKTHLATEKDFVLQHSLKINEGVGVGERGGGGPNKFCGGLEKNWKTNKWPPIY